MTWVDPPPRGLVIPLFVIAAMVTMPLASLAGPSTPADWTVKQTNPGRGSQAIGEVASDPTDPDFIIATSCGGGGDTNISKSTDAGLTWTNQTIHAEDSRGGSCDIEFNPSDTSKIAVTSIDNADRDLNVMVSTDSGSTWSVTQDVITGATAVSESAVLWQDGDTLTVYGYMNNDNIEAATSNDTGANFDAAHQILSPGSGNAPNGCFCAHWRQDPSDQTTARYFSEAGTAISSDGGITWSTIQASNLTGGGSEAMMDMITASRWIAVGNNGAQTTVHETTDTGQTWTLLYTDTNSTTPFDIESSGTDAWGYTYTWDSDARLTWSEDEGSSWTETLAAQRNDPCGITCQVYALDINGQYTISFEDNSDDARYVATSDAPGGFTQPPGLDTFTTPDAAATVCDRTAYWLETDWVNDTAGHEIYLRCDDGSSTQGTRQRVKVFNPALDLVRQASICNLNGFTEYTDLTGFALTRELNERLLYPCSDPVTDYLLVNGTTWLAQQETGLEAVSKPWDPAPPACSTPNRCAVADLQNTEIDKLDPLNGVINWTRDQAGIVDATADHSGLDKYAATGSFGTRIYGPSGAIQASNGVLEHDAIELNDTDVWVANDISIARAEISGSTLTVKASNNTYQHFPQLVQLSKDARYVMAATEDLDKVIVYTSDTLEAVVEIDLPNTRRVLGFDMDASNTYLYVLDDTTIRQYQLTATNVTSPTPTQYTEPGATSGGQNANITDNAPAASTGFGDLFEDAITDWLGPNADKAGWVAGGLMVLTFTLLSAGAVSKLGAKPETGVYAGMIAGIAISMSFGWLPKWLLFVAGTIAAAVISLKVVR